MKITECKGMNLFKICLLSAYEETDERKPEHCTTEEWDFRNPDYMLELFAAMVENELISISSFEIMRKFLYSKKEKRKEPIIKIVRRGEPVDNI